MNDANAVSFAYDNDLLLKQAGDLVISRGHAAGLITRTKLGNQSTSQNYNPFGELDTLSASAQGFKQVYTRASILFMSAVAI